MHHNELLEISHMGRSFINISVETCSKFGILNMPKMAIMFFIEIYMMLFMVNFVITSQ